MILLTLLYQTNKTSINCIKNRGLNIVIWDSINAVVEEYLRSCALIQRLRKDNSKYFSCDDFIHPGYGALSVGTQILVHHLCATG